MGYLQSEVRDLRFRIAPMSTGQLRLIAEGVYRGKRKTTLFEPTQLVAINGWGHPELEVWTKDENGGRRARFGWPSHEYSVLLDDYLKALRPNLEIIFDYRVEGATALEGAQPQIVALAFEENAKPSSDSNSTKDPVALREGSVAEVVLDRYERNPVARQICLDHYGYVCRACQVDMESTYGELGRQYVHVHHRVPLADIGEDYKVDPVSDLVPVCPNCHAMLHRSAPVLSVEELRGIIERRRR